ncbi:insulin-like growth factor-binding protein 1a [Engraulis encrasicolus]|uniref:insulin-like growth factor-binding protein 1a n=1 Tax=Engraulis encrasicolus TaxID=184585 RepID=UPI002FCF414A
MMSRLNLNIFVMAALGSVLLLLLSQGVRGSPVATAQEPIRCAPCSPERIASCPAVDPSCEEVLREPGCGCCMACALKAGVSCGSHTASCGSGLRCLPKPGETRPLHALLRGQGICTEKPDTDTERNQTPQTAEQPSEADGESVVTEAGNPLILSGHGKPIDPRLAAGAQESMKAKANAIKRKLVEQGPCHVELQRALEKISKSQQKLGDKLTRFYLPNCDKVGRYKAKQCESSLDGTRGKCWCVSLWSGKRIPGSGDLPEDSECPLEYNH